MIKFDFKTYAKSFINEEEFNSLYSRKNEMIEKLKSYEMTGWMKPISPELVSDIKRCAKNIKDNYDCLVVIGIGGSFLGSYSFSKLFQKYFDDRSFSVIYAGTTLSSKYLEELQHHLDKKNFCINVISKSGSTMETNVTYQILKDLLRRKYSEDELKNRIIITTDKATGPLHEEAMVNNYQTFDIPENIGGRYSFLTAAHLLPLALNYNIDDIVEGYYEGERLIDICL